MAKCRKCQIVFEATGNRLQLKCPQCEKRTWNLQRCEGCDIGKPNPAMFDPHYSGLIYRAADLAARLQFGVAVNTDDLFPDEYRAMMIFLEEQEIFKREIEDEAIKSANQKK